MYYIVLDTCVLLDISTRKNDLPIVSALEALTSSKTIKLVIPDIVITEYEKNKDDVANKTVKRLSYEFKQVKNIVNEFELKGSVTNENHSHTSFIINY